MNEYKKKKRTIGDFVELNQKRGQHWFDQDTLRFFDSWYSPLYGGKYFISSEKAPHTNRRWTIRKANWKTGGVETIGEFQQYATKKQAMKKLEKLLK